jgi:branched-chain amino acid transport system ATP-binding protein
VARRSADVAADRQEQSKEGPVLELEAITAGYGRSTVLREVQVVIDPGMIACLIGPNGAGKTTLLHTAAGLIEPSSGCIRICGEDVTQWPPWKRSRAGLCLVPEGRGIFRTLSVYDNLRMQVPPRRDTNGFDAAFDAFPVLLERLHSPAARLSGGEQQMLALARAYLSKPTVILVDEVSMGLAPKMIDIIYESLVKLADQGIAILLVEQYVNRAIEVADTAYLINRGSISFAGPSDEVLKHEVQRAYLGVETSVG